MIKPKLRIKEVRKKHKYQQKYIANILNVSQSQYSRYELCYSIITFEQLTELAFFYNTSTDFLLGITDCEIPYPRKNI